MIRFSYTFFVLFFLSFSFSFSQSGTLKGRVIDGTNAESIPMVNISLYKDGALIDYKFIIMFIPIRWITLITKYDHPNLFVDQKLK